MKDQNLRVGTIGALVAVALVGCTSTPRTIDRVAEAAAAKSESSRSLSATELGVITPLSDSAVAAVQADDFWGNSSKASAGADGKLVYTSDGGIVDDPSYNRQQLEVIDTRVTDTRSLNRLSDVNKLWGPRSNEVLLQQGPDVRGGAQTTISAPVQRDRTVRRAPRPQRQAAPQRQRSSQPRADQP